MKVWILHHKEGTGTRDFYYRFEKMGFFEGGPFQLRLSIPRINSFPEMVRVKALKARGGRRRKKSVAEQKKKKTKRCFLSFWYPIKGPGRMALAPRAGTGDSVGRFQR